MGTKVYAVNYDLRQFGRDYQALYGGIRRIDALACWAQGSLWFVSSSASALTLTMFLRTLVDSNDTVFVTEITENWFSSNLPDYAVGWLSARKPNVLSMNEGQAWGFVARELQATLPAARPGFLRLP